MDKKLDDPPCTCFQQEPSFERLQASLRSVHATILDDIQMALAIAERYGVPLETELSQRLYSLLKAGVGKQQIAQVAVRNLPIGIRTKVLMLLDELPGFTVYEGSEDDNG